MESSFKGPFEFVEIALGEDAGESGNIGDGVGVSDPRGVAIVVFLGIAEFPHHLIVEFHPLFGIVEQHPGEHRRLQLQPRIEARPRELIAGMHFQGVVHPIRGMVEAFMLCVAIGAQIRHLAL